MIFLTGSRALNFWYPEHFPLKNDSDWDIVGNISPSKEKLIDVAPDGLESSTICSYYSSDCEIDTPAGKAYVLSPEGLMLFKRSHLHRPIDFQKHIRHYHFLKEKFPLLIANPVYKYFLHERTVLTKVKYGDRTPKLNKSKKDFFDDYVSKKYEHDEIHYATCFGERPIYEELKTDDDKVWCSKDKWNQLPHEKKINCVAEEAFVIALERYIIPKLGNNPPPARYAFIWAQERICTTLTSGWFRDFAIENWPEIKDNQHDFLGKFLKWTS